MKPLHLPVCLLDCQLLPVVVIKLRRLLGVALCVKVLSPLLLAPLASSLLILMNTESNQKVGFACVLPCGSGKWHLMGVMLSAAGSYQWFRNQLCGEEVNQEKETGRDAYEILNEAAASISPGAEDCFFALSRLVSVLLIPTRMPAAVSWA